MLRRRSVLFAMSLCLMAAFVVTVFNRNWSTLSIYSMSVRKNKHHMLADLSLSALQQLAMQHGFLSTTSIMNETVSHAYFTLISSMEYVIGAQILVCKLRHYSSNIPIFVLVDESMLIPPDVTATTSSKRFTREKYIRFYNYFTNTLNTTVVVVPDLAVRVPQEILKYNRSQPVAMVKDEIRSKTYTKLNVWQFVNVQNVGVYFDADTIPIRNPEHLLYELDHSTTLAEFGVCGYEEYFNTGVFVFRPSQNTFEALVQRLRYGNYSKIVNNPTEQDLLVSHFGNHQNKSLFLSDDYNYRPLNNQAGWQVDGKKPPEQQGPAIVHYIGNPKPWTYIFGKSTSIDGLFTTIENTARTSLPLWSVQLYQQEMEEFFTRCI